MTPKGKQILWHKKKGKLISSKFLKGQAKKMDSKPQALSNTGDKIKDFAKKFADQIKKAVGAGFDQANEATGELPGAAGKLNRDTRELVFSKLSKWLDDRKSGAYNHGALDKAHSTAEVPDGTENHQ